MICNSNSEVDGVWISFCCLFGTRTSRTAACVALRKPWSGPIPPLLCRPLTRRPCVRFRGRQRPCQSPPPAFGRQRCRLDFVIAASLAHARHALPPVWPCANRGAGRYSLCCAPYKKPMCRPGRQRPWQSPPTSGLRPSSRRRNRKVR